MTRVDGADLVSQLATALDLSSVDNARLSATDALRAAAVAYELLRGRLKALQVRHEIVQRPLMGWDVPDRLQPEVLVDLLNLSADAWLELRRHEEVFLGRDLYFGNFWYEWFQMVSTLAGHHWDFSQRQIVQHLAFRVVDVLRFCTPVRHDVGKRALEALF